AARTVVYRAKVGEEVAGPQLRFEASSMKFTYGLGARGEVSVSGDKELAVDADPEPDTTTVLMRLEAGWNAMVFAVEPDEESARSLVVYPAKMLDGESGSYVQVKEYHACILFWVYAEVPAGVVVRGSVPTEPPAGQNLAGWTPYGVVSSQPRDNAVVMLEWLEGCFRPVTEETLWPGRGYLRKPKPRQ
ncbi:MAG: hypothetical protein J5654_12635, partial [Victivallales bacterium]|nr:hypothetical protein [Victivallales bacterium]